KTKKRNQNTLSLTPDMKVAKVIQTWPQTLDTFVKMGFSPLKSAVLRQTFGKNVSIQQAANFRNVDLNILMHNLQNAITNPTEHHEAFLDQERLRFDENTIPELKGDVTVTGLLPCPICNILTEKFDAFIQSEFSSKGKKVGWWMAAEGTGLGDVKKHIKSVVKSNQFDNFPDIFVAVGTELFLHEEYGRKLYQYAFAPSLEKNINARKEFSKLEDPENKLQLQFVVTFSFYCNKDALGNIPLPQTWFDLTEERYKGHLVIPSLYLPVISDFLAALYHYLGGSLFLKFCDNVVQSQHPAQSSSRKKQEVDPGIYVTPLHFSKIMKSSSGVHITPKDGFITVPSYIANSSPDNKHAKKINSYLLSKDYLVPYFQLGSFIPNHANIPVDIPLDKLICRPWSSLINNIPDELHRQLLENFKLKKT
ncbi:MAG: ABC transporter substrate-binding protein, partial [Bacteroidales bacterium]|nr:ABC transporter substrate-binding protein [Bacteroidales bacterium]